MSVTISFRTPIIFLVRTWYECNFIHLNASHNLVQVISVVLKIC